MARSRLLLKRKFLASTGGILSGPFARRAPPPLQTDLPAPLFSPRQHLIHWEEEMPVLDLAGRAWPLSDQIEWHPDELEMGTRLEKLHLHYMEYLEALDDFAVQHFIGDWIDFNPPYRRGYWLDNWNSYALSIRCVVWMQQFQSRQAQWTPEFRSKLLGSLAAQLRFLTANLEEDIRGNHIIKNIKALLWGGRFFAGAEAASWTHLGEQLLQRELPEQVFKDGFHFERSPAYHIQVFADLSECYSVMRAGLLRERLSSILDRMAQPIADHTHPDGLPSLFNDGGLHMTYSPAECLRVFSILRGPPPNAQTIFAYEDAGYYGTRDGDSLAIVDCGAIAPDFLPAHGHGDVFAFEWSYHGERLIVDAGVYEYHAGEWRDYSRSTRAHNTVTVAGEDQAEFWGAFRVGRRPRVLREHYEITRNGFVLEGAHDGYRHLGIIHRRRLDVAPMRISVCDRIEGGRGQEVTARLLLHPNCQVREDAGRWVIRGRTAEVGLTTSASVRIERAWWMSDFGVREETLQLILQYPPAPCAGHFLLEGRAR
ncbi:MAG TPA: alginate lyase family protein [Longimicrobiaceae bacterium]|nr:alginate lyase family protein [Longimicrobiaceae bacterium]